MSRESKQLERVFRAHLHESAEIRREILQRIILQNVSLKNALYITVGAAAVSSGLYPLFRQGLNSISPEFLLHPFLWACTTVVIAHGISMASLLLYSSYQLMMAFRHNIYLAWLRKQVVAKCTPGNEEVWQSLCDEHDTPWGRYKCRYKFGFLQGLPMLLLALFSPAGLTAIAFVAFLRAYYLLFGTAVALTLCVSLALILTCLEQVRVHELYREALYEVKSEK